MKISGKTPGINKGSIEFYRGSHILRLTVQAVPYGVPERLEREMPMPEPPLDFARDPKSGAVLRGEDGLAVKTEKTSDRKWQTESGRVRALRLILRVREALRNDPEIEFEIEQSEPKLSGRAYAEKLEQEFKDAGFSDSELVQIFNKSRDLERGGPQRVEDKQESFLPAGPVEQASQSSETTAAPGST